MPPGWITQWDQNSQRWYYVEQGTGRMQWDPPTFSPAPQGPYALPPSGTPASNVYGAPVAHQDERVLFGDTHGHSGHDKKAHKEDKDKEKDKSVGIGTAAAAGVGSSAVGAFAGHALADDSDDEVHNHYYGVTPLAAAAAAAAAAPPPLSDSAFAPLPPVPTHDADGDSISSSDRESPEEKRQELIETQGECEEELEEAYDD
ncbi:hypothetical protein K469DRAFT_58213 [Zopfia rhizophila CBS 207.26]|uniref:WW domain-containing protein n=1 Tax=Zopfia rhizophila CBS 207.26 TaxID=1314779 RepID=A0A6A6ED57_9PEZI|nr:hypothetical protein K469DRAFT_58213 [Zopfia rhizophila CBS 207.26]